MAKHVTTWRPDTCGCVLRYGWDDENPDATREHTPTEVVEVCAAHAGKRSVRAHFELVHGENVHKNRVLAALADAAADDDVHIIPDGRGGHTRVLKRIPPFSFNANRQLEIDLSHLPAETKGAMRQHLDAFEDRQIHVK